MEPVTGLLFFKSVDDTTALVELRIPGLVAIPPIVELNGESWAQNQVHTIDDGSTEIIFTPLSTDDPPLMVILEAS